MTVSATNPPPTFSLTKCNLAQALLQWDPLADQKPAACIHFFQKKL